MATALASLATGRPVRPDLAMTGEITLTGRVLPVGGIKEKVLAAKEAGIHEIILPTQNRKDLTEIPEHIRNALTFHFVENMDEVLELALQPTPEMVTV
jgi:ATP-dependent Lon protease